MKEITTKVYEVYELNPATGDGIMIGILPERRKDRLRITKESVLNWGRILLGDKAKFTNIFFIEINLHKTKKGNIWPFSIGNIKN